MRRTNTHRYDPTKRCAATRRFRWRAQAAEARAAAMEAERDAARAERDAAEARIRAERRALVAVLESAEWRRDLLVLARDRVRAEAINLAMRRATCGTCGGFGSGFVAGLLEDEIERVSRENRLPIVPPRALTDWPEAVGAYARGGRVLDRGWLDLARGDARRERGEGPKIW